MKRLPSSIGLAAGVIALAWAVPARANGAFPDSESVLVPAALPNEIALGTNFGVVLSKDGGQTWTWSCEQGGSNASLYQIGPAPLNRIYAIGLVGLTATLIYSDDMSCSWHAAAGTAQGPTIADAFPDPTNAQRVLAVAAQSGDAGATYHLLPSSDGGTTFGASIYDAAAGDRLTGVEIARSAPSTIYLTVLSGSGTSVVPKLARSVDGGSTWEVHDLSAALGAGVTSVRILAVDANDAGKVFLRVTSAASGESVAVASGGGTSIATALSVSGGVITAFTRMPSGSLIVGGVGGTSGIEPVAFRSTDGGGTFQPLPTPPHLRALAARATTLYAVADNQNDGFAIATSPDEGATWQPLMSYDQISAIATCVMATCQTDCLARAAMGQWSSDLCAATAPPPADAGMPVSDAGSDASGSGHPDAAADAGRTPNKDKSGCNCSLGAPARAGRSGGAALLLLLSLWAARRRPSARP
jgi:hypothetical protein